MLWAKAPDYLAASLEVTVHPARGTRRSREDRVSRFARVGWPVDGVAKLLRRPPPSGLVSGHLSQAHLRFTQFPIASRLGDSVRPHAFQKRSNMGFRIKPGRMERSSTIRAGIVKLSSRIGPPRMRPKSRGGNPRPRTRIRVIPTDTGERTPSACIDAKQLGKWSNTSASQTSDINRCPEVFRISRQLVDTTSTIPFR